MNTSVSLTLLLTSGLIFGLRHAFDPDHIAAVSTLVSRSRNMRSATGCVLFWGIGHTVTLLIVGLLMVGMRLTITDPVGAYLEGAVGLMLIFLGLRIFYLRSAFVTRRSAMGVNAIPQKGMSFSVGMVHGLAGSSGLMALGVTAAASYWHAILYILLFGFGTLSGMIIFNTLLGIPLMLKFRRFSDSLQPLAGGVSIALGCVIFFDTIRLI